VLELTAKILHLMGDETLKPTILASASRDSASIPERRKRAPDARLETGFLHWMKDCARPSNGYKKFLQK
jgi:hypothetical protein